MRPRESEKVLRFVRRAQARGLQDHVSNSMEQIALDSRVIIVEGISGSGKDTLQSYLKTMLTARDVYDYSEGELLQSWNQLQIGGIFKLRVKFMKLFVNYVRDTVTRDHNAVFLLNRFHLSAYVMTIMQQPKLEREYNEVINILRTLPVHVFILQLDESEVEKRSLHPERSRAWQKFQHQIVKKEGFRDRVQRYIWQQQKMLEAAEKQQLPYSVVKLFSAYEIGNAWGRAAEPQDVLWRGVRTNVSDSNISRKKKDISRLLQKHS